jgi:hypothetical protein
MPSPVSRQLIHTRQIHTQVFRRDDDLWDIEISLIDTKGKDFHLASSMRKKGEPIHHMTLTVTIDTQFKVLAAKAESLAVPYPGTCELITPDYSKLVGLNLLSGFRAEVKNLFKGIKGCSHITELCSVLPTAAIQGFAGEILQSRAEELSDPTQMPFQLNGCHALRTDGEVVKNHYKVWYGAPLVAPEMPKLGTKD